MNKKILLIVILVLTICAITITLIFNRNIKYNKLIIDNENWNNIISNRNLSTNIYLENIEFNDYNLLIDEDNSIIYYSVVNSSNKYNPSIKYVTNKKVNIKVNDEITNDKLEQTNSLNILLYNDKEYRIYSLVVTNYPTLNVTYKNINDKDKKVPIELELFDNHVNSFQRVLKSDGIFRTIEEDQVYSFSLFKQSLGNNKRENHISIFGMDLRDEYIIRKVNNVRENDKYVRLFINNKYNGLYLLGHKEGGINNFERNRENNK